MINKQSDTKQQDQKPLPAGWRWVKLREVCELNPRRPVMTRDDDAPTTFVPMPVVNERRGIIAEPEVRPYGEIKKGYTYFAENDVLFAKITPCMQNGKHAIAKSLLDKIGFGSTEFHVIRPSEDIDSRWIHYFIRQPYVLHDAMAHFTGAVGQQRVPEDYLASLQIPLPPLSEQKHIAAILAEQLGAVEKGRFAAQAQLDAAKTLQAAYLRAIFPKPGAELAPGWRWAKLGEVCIRETGTRNPRISPDESFQYVDISSVDNTLKRIAKAQVLIGNEAPSRARQVILKDDILVATTRPNLNAVAKVQPELDNQICSTGFCVLRAMPDLLLPDYLFAFVRHESFIGNLSELVKGALYPAVTDSQVKAQSIPLPPFSEQKRITEVLIEQMEATENLLENLKSQLNEINGLPATLLRKAFRGELQ